MSTEVQNILPIPESTVVGTGVYVIPANKYGFLSANTVSTGMGFTGNANNFNTVTAAYNGNTRHGSTTANNAHQYVIAGDTISSDFNNPNRANSGTGGAFFFENNSLSGYFRVLLNGNVFCAAMSSALAGYMQSSGLLRCQFDGQRGWSVSLFPIPKNNLPAELIEGN